MPAGLLLRFDPIDGGIGAAESVLVVCGSETVQGGSSSGAVAALAGESGAAIAVFSFSTLMEEGGGHFTPTVTGTSLLAAAWGQEGGGGWG